MRGSVLVVSGLNFYTRPRRPHVNTSAARVLFLCRRREKSGRGKEKRQHVASARLPRPATPTTTTTTLSRRATLSLLCHLPHLSNNPLPRGEAICFRFERERVLSVSRTIKQPSECVSVTLQGESHRQKEGEKVPLLGGAGGRKGGGGLVLSSATCPQWR